LHHFEQIDFVLREAIRPHDYAASGVDIEITLAPFEHLIHIQRIFDLPLIR
jgi:hypothetical protein